MITVILNTQLIINKGAETFANTNKHSKSVFFRYNNLRCKVTFRGEIRTFIYSSKYGVAPDWETSCKPRYQFIGPVKWNTAGTPYSARKQGKIKGKYQISISTKFSFRFTIFFGCIFCIFKRM